MAEEEERGLVPDDYFEVIQEVGDLGDVQLDERKEDREVDLVPSPLKTSPRKSLSRRTYAQAGKRVKRATLVLVTHPRKVVLGVVLLTVLAQAATIAVGFEVATPTPYDWECPEDKYTIRRDMMAAAADDADEAAALRTRGDFTFGFAFLYDAEPPLRRDTCSAPEGIFTADNVRAMCETERVLTGHPRYEADFCVLDRAGGCASGAMSVLSAFYAANETRTCPRISQERVDQGWAAMRANEAQNAFYVDERAFSRGFACKARSIVYLGSPHAGYDEVARLDDSQFTKLENTLGADVKQDLWDHFDMKGHMLKSEYLSPARAGAGGRKFSVMWGSMIVERFEWSRMVNEDMMVAFASIAFVFCYLCAHMGSAFVGAWAMLQIVLSLPLSLFWYRVVLQIRYFGTMQMLVIFVILGVGADDCFVFSDAWKQAAALEERPTDPGQLRMYRHRRLTHAYVRALQSMFNTSLTTTAAFLATALSPIMPIAAFGIYAALCVLMNYALAMTMLPAVLVWRDEWRSCPERRVEAAEGGRFVDGYLRALAWGRSRPLAKVLVVTLGGLSCASAYLASRLEPPREPERWFSPRHMFQQVADLADGAHRTGVPASARGPAGATRRAALLRDGRVPRYGTNEDRAYDTLHVVLGLDKLARRRFDPYVPDRHRGRARYSEGFDLHTDEAQAAFLEVCDLVDAYPCDARACQRGLLARPNTTLCFLREFRAWHADAYGAPPDGLARETFDARLLAWRDGTAPADAALYSSWQDVVGFVGGQLKYARVDCRLSMDPESSSDHRRETLRRTNALLSDVRRAAARAPGLKASDAFHVSLAWIWFKSQVALVRGLLVGLAPRRAVPRPASARAEEARARRARRVREAPVPRRSWASPWPSRCSRSRRRTCSAPSSP